jgi:hypothetical protein
MKCPHCQGEGSGVAVFCGRQGGADGGSFCHTRRLTCSTCEGRCEISEEHAERIAAGRRLREDRVARRMSQREEAERLGITPQELSRREQGRE